MMEGRFAADMRHSTGGYGVSNVWPGGLACSTSYGLHEFV